VKAHTPKRKEGSHAKTPRRKGFETESEADDGFWLALALKPTLFEPKTDLSAIALAKAENRKPKTEKPFEPATHTRLS